MSYFTVVIPLSCVALYGANFLYGRIIKKAPKTRVEIKANHQANRVLKPTTATTVNNTQTTQGTAETPKTTVSTLTTPYKTITLVEALDKLYKPGFAPQKNRANLLNYFSSPDFEQHARTAHVYYNGTQLVCEDAQKVVFRREPTNIEIVE